MRMDTMRGVNRLRVSLNYASFFFVSESYDTLKTKTDIAENAIASIFIRMPISRLLLSKLETFLSRQYENAHYTMNLTICMALRQS